MSITELRKMRSCDFGFAFLKDGLYYGYGAIRKAGGATGARKCCDF